MLGWLKDLNLTRPFRIGSSYSIEHKDSIPEWAAFLIWAGWWISDIQFDGGVLYTFILLPSRLCCSALSAFGSLLRSAQQGGTDVLSWSDFYHLPIGSVFYCLYPKKGKPNSCKARIIEPSERCLKRFEIVDDESETKIEVSHSGSFYKYRIRLTPHPPTRRRKQLNSYYSFYNAIVDDFRVYWLQSTNIACMLVTNRTGWNRDLNDLIAEAVIDEGSPIQHSLSDLLMTGVDRNTQKARVLLSSPGDDQPDSKHIPVVILDGPNAFRSYRSISASRVLILLEYREYDENISNDLVSLICRRDDNLISNLSIPSAEPPLGIEMLIFAIAGELT